MYTMLNVVKKSPTDLPRREDIEWGAQGGLRFALINADAASN